jgi:hypothetical protein
MEKKQRSALRRFRRVQEFLTTNQVEGTAVKLQVLDQVVREMTSRGEEQDASDRLARGVTARQAALRDALRSRHMAPLSRIARRVFEVPEVRAKFQLPEKRADNVAILNSARGMAQVAEQHAAVFTQEGLPAEFLAQFRGAIDELTATLVTRDQSQNRRKSSREALYRLAKRGVAAVDVLDAIVQPRLASQPDLLATWYSVKRHIEVGGGSSAGAVEPDITPLKAA